MVFIYMATSQDQRSGGIQNNQGENCSQSLQVVDKCFRVGGIFRGSNLLLLIRYVKRI